MQKQIDVLLPANTSMNAPQMSLPTVSSCKWCVAEHTVVTGFYLRTHRFPMKFHFLFTCECFITIRASKTLRSLRMLLPYVTLFVIWLWKRKTAVWTMITILSCTTLLLMNKEIAFAKFLSAGRTGSWIRYFWHVANLSCFTKMSTPSYTPSKVSRAMTSMGKSGRKCLLRITMIRLVPHELLW